MTDIEIVRSSEVAPAELTSAISSAFVQPKSTEWYQWKHVDGPWGPSWGCAAMDDRGVVGVRLLLPWQLRMGSRTVLVHRAVEAATVPRAQGRGVFSALNRELMQRLGETPTWTSIFSTPNEQSRSGYQKLGWRLLPLVRHGYRPIGGLPARGNDLTDAVLDTYEPAEDGDAIRTAWTPDALRWRFDPRCGEDYESAALRQSELANGIVYRITRRLGLRILLPLLTWGARQEVRQLLAGVARRVRATLVLEAVGPGAEPPTGGPRLLRGGSLLAVWSNGHPTEGDWPVMDINRWSLQLADLESVL